MRLKLFFAPLVFLAIVVVSIWYVWPAIQDVQAKRKEVDKSQKALDSTIEKKKNVEILRALLDKNKEKEDFILSYFPPSRSEERIVDGISFLATDSGLNLSSISIKEDKANIQIEQPVSVIAANPTIINNPSSSTEPIVIEKPKPVARIVNVEATVSGKYENLKIFLDQVYRMNMFNKISSLSVAKGDLNKSENAEGEQPNSDILIINVGLTFGYLPLIHEQEGGSSPIFSNSTINFNPYAELNEQITKRIPALDEGQKGKSNPFLP